MARVYLSLGSNIEREVNITSALDALQDQFGGLVLSSVYESEAVGFDGHAFYNLVVGLDADLSLSELSVWLRQVEADHGRQRGEQKFSDRTLDIDILTYDDCVGTVAGIELPRDEIVKYAFVLQPLAEIAGSERLPGGGLSYSQLWQQFDKTGPALWVVPFSWQGRSLPLST